LRAILERAEGNPFFTEELLRMLVEDGFLTREQTEWRLERDLPASLPDTVRSVIAARIDLLPANEKHAIQSASAIGRIFWEGAVERLEGNAVDAALEGLIAKRLVWEREHSALEGEREFSFNHVLTRDVAYASLSHARRTTAHGTAAAWIEEATQGRSEEFAEVLSHHYERAGEADRAARYALLAGQRLQHLFLAADAIRWYDRALETFSGTSDRIGEALQMETLSSRGAALEQLGSFADAEDAYTAALELAEHLGDGAAETGALAALAQVKRLQDKHDEARRVLDRALERARNVGERTLLSRLLYTAGTIAWGSGQWGAARRLHEEAREVAIAAADPVGEAFAEHGLAEVCFYAGPFEEGLEHAARCSTLAEERGQRPLLYENENQRGCLLWLLGRIEEARNVFDRSIEGAGEVGDRRNETFGLAEASLVLLSRGEFDAALDQACGSVERSMKLGAPRLELTCRACRIAVLAEFAALELMREDVAAALALSDRLGGSFSRARFIAARGWLELASGDDAAARVSFSEASLAADSKQEPLWCALIELRAWEHAGDSAAELDAAAGRLCEGDAEETVIFGSWGTYGLGLAAARRGEWDAALTVAKAAIARAEATFELPVVRRAAALAADALTALGEEQEAERYRLRSARGEPAATAKDDGVAAAATGLS
jgi:tetratricopeptide (TPR) repeat protein